MAAATAAFIDTAFYFNRYAGIADSTYLSFTGNSLPIIIYRRRRPVSAKTIPFINT
jgi:hypothetical protein